MNRFALIVVLLFAQTAFADSIPVSIATTKGPVPLKLELAATPEVREKGLMHRKTLKPYDGMLFLFPVPGKTSFWMKDTPLPLDILFVDEDGKIIHIAHETKPLSLTPISSGGIYEAAIEIDGGRAEREGIKEGDYAIYTLPKDLRVQ